MTDAKKHKRSLTPLESAALASFIMGVALFIALEAGLVHFGRLPADRQPSSIPASHDDGAGTASVARAKALHDKIEIVEKKMLEKAETLQRMNAELQDFSKRISAERKSLNTVSTMVLEIEAGRSRMKRESGVLTEDDDIMLDDALVQIAAIARDTGIPPTHVGTIKWKNRGYLRLVNAFEFQDTGIYLRKPGLDKVDHLADAIEGAGLRELNVVYRDTDSGGTQQSRERAFVLRNRFKELLGNEYRVKVSRVSSGLVAPDAVELWMGQE